MSVAIPPTLTISTARIGCIVARDFRGLDGGDARPPGLAHSRSAVTVRLSEANREEVMSCAKEAEGATARFPTSGPRPRAGGVPVAVS